MNQTNKTIFCFFFSCFPFKFSNLLDLAKEKMLCTDEEVAKLKNHVASRKDWLTTNVKSYKDNFFVGKCSSGTHLMAIPSLLFILFGLTRWNWV